MKGKKMKGEREKGEGVGAYCIRPDENRLQTCSSGVSRKVIL